MLRLFRYDNRLIAFCAFFFLLAFRPIESFDTFWQLQSGRYLWQTHAFIYQDIFSIAKDVFRLEHCWLSDLIFYLFYSLGGYPLLTLLKPLTIALCALLLYRWNVRRGVESALALPTLTLCLMASEPSWLVRPQLWTFVFSLLYIHLLFSGRQKGLRSWLWLVPIMLAWANLHAACVFGFVLIGLFGVAELIRAVKGQTSWGEWGKLVGVGFLTLAVSFVNPYGYRIPMVLLGNFNLHAIDNPGQLWNMEWLPPTFAQVPLFYIVMVLWGVLILCRLRRVDPAEGIFFLAFLYMGLSQIRHTTLVALLAGYFLPMALQEVVVPLWRKWWPRLPLLALCRWGTMVVLLGLLLQRILTGALGVGLKEEQYPVAATDFLIEHCLPANLYNAYDWGGYLMWRLYPDYLVFVDGRSDSMETFNASTQVDNRWEGWRETLDRYGINTALIRTCYFDTGEPVNLLDGLVRDPDWALVYRDAVAVIFVRKTADFQWGPLVMPSVLAYETMLAEAQRLYDADPRYRSPALLTMGRASFHLQRYPQALGYYRQFLEIEPDNREARLATSILEARGIGQ
jgi:hypothetical protein